MNILAFTHGLGMGGAQVSTLEFFELLRSEINLRVVLCENAEKEFVRQLQVLDIEYRLVPCSMSAEFPNMNVNFVEDWLRWSDIAWITDVEFLVAPKIKKIRNVPIIAHLRSYPLICPWWGLLYGMREVCYKGCSVSRIVRCKQLFNRELARLGIIRATTSNFYQILDLAKGPFDYVKWRRIVNKEVISSIDGFVAVSNFVKKIHEELLPIESKPIETIYNPITYPLKYVQNINFPKGRENLIVYASGSNPVKGPHILLESLKLLLSKNLDVKLIMFNCGGTWVEKYARRLGVEKSVVFMKKAPLNELYRKISMANIVVMPSLWPEPFGRVAAEANRLGVMAIVTKRGGLPENIIHEETGLLAEASSEDLAKKIEMSIKLRRSRERIRKSSLSKINPNGSLNALLKFFETF